MLQIGAWHPQVVHFVVAFLVAGVVARVAALTPLGARFAFLSSTGTVLIVLGALGSLLAVHSGLEAHGPAERIPGARSAVVDHEAWGIRTRNMFLMVAALEIGAVAWRARRWSRALQAGAAVSGLVGLWMLYVAAAHGGDLVYAYAGGVGTRSGDTADVRRLLVAGLYHTAQLERSAGRHEAAARLLDELRRQREDDPDVLMLVVESRILDRKDPGGALNALDAFTPPPDNRRLVLRAGALRADALEALGRRDSARAVVEGLLRLSPGNQRLADRLSRLR